MSRQSQTITLIGAGLNGPLLGLELAKRGFAFYLAQVPTYTLIYGAFATVPIFLIWLYVSWLVVLAGAVFTAALPAYYAKPERARAPGEQLADALGSHNLSPDTAKVAIRAMYLAGKLDPKLNAVLSKYAGLDARFREEVGRLEAALRPEALALERLPIRPKKADITVEQVVLAWTP